MLAIGMVASFLTGNLTVGFILGALFNAPLAFAGSIPDSFSLFGWSIPLTFIKRLSITEQFRDFSRGVISLASIGYFLSIVAVMLYLSMVLIGRRHWRGGAEGRGVAGQYAVRFLSLLVVVVAGNVFLTHHDKLRARRHHRAAQFAVAAKAASSIANLETTHPVVIEDFVSPDVPEGYVQTRLNLLATVRELQAVGGDKIQVIGHNVEPYSEEATCAEQQFGIHPVHRALAHPRGPQPGRHLPGRGVHLRARQGRGAVSRSGHSGRVRAGPLDRHRQPAEAQEGRRAADRRQAVRRVRHADDVQMGRNEQIIDELEKQYDVVQVDPTNPITEKYDVLLAVQPSSLGPDQMENFMAAVKAGQPTAIFEDPCPLLAADVPGTNAPKQPGGGNPFAMQRQPPQPKGDISELWRVLGVDFAGDNVVWQTYNPYPKFSSIQREWVFVDYGSGAQHPFNPRSEISKKLQQVLFLFPGAVSGLHSSQMKFTELLSTNDRTGTVRTDQIFERSMMGQPRMNPELPLLEHPTNEKYILAAQITGKPKSENLPMSGEAAEEPKTADATTAEATDAKPADGKAAEAKPAKASDAKAPGSPGETEPEINVVVVGDIDCLYSAFFNLRARGGDPDDEVDFHFDNVPFVLNVLDTLAGDDRFVEIRTRRPAHRVLTRVNEATEKSRDVANHQREAFSKKYEQEVANARKNFQQKLDEVEKETGGNSQQQSIQMLMARENAQRLLDTKLSGLKRDRDEQIKVTEAALARGE